MQPLADKYQDKGVSVIGINSFDQNNKTAIVQKLRDKGIVFPTLFSSRSLVDQLGFNAFPRYLIIADKTRLLFSGFGTIADLDGVLSEQLGH